MERLIVVNDADKKRIIKEISLKKEINHDKIMSLFEFQRKFYFDYDEKTIYYIVKHQNVTSEIARIFIKNLYYLQASSFHSQSEKIAFLQKLYEELKENNLLIFHPLWKNSLKQKEVIFYHIIKKTKEVENMMMECQKITSVQVVDIEEKTRPSYTIHEFENPEQEVIGVCLKICDILKQKGPYTKIYLTNLNDEYRLLLEMYQEVFHLPLCLKKEESLFSNELVATFLNHYDEGIEKACKELSEGHKEKEEQIILEQILDTCNRYAFISKEKERKEFIIADLKKRKQTESTMLNAISEIKFLEEEIEEDAMLFVLGVQEGSFPIISKENAFLTNEDYTKLHLDTSREKNQKEKKWIIKRLSSLNEIYLSYPSKLGKIKQTISSIFEECSYEIQKENTGNVHHSNLYNQWMLGIKEDNLRKYGIQDQVLNELRQQYPNQYLSYQNKFHHFPQKEKLSSLSYTSIDTFFHCPFRFYVEQVLKIKETEDTFSLKIGNLFHQILKETFEEAFDFETNFQKNVQEMAALSPKEHFFLQKLKKDIKWATQIIKEQNDLNTFQVLLEEKINVPISKDLVLTGILDKVLYKKEKGETYIAIVDYKTGNASCSLEHLPYGLNMQLPIYLVLADNLPFLNKKIIGFYLQKILPDIPKCDNIHSEEELKQKKLMLQGYTIDEESLLSLFDPSYENSKLIQGLKKGNNGFYAYSKMLSQEMIQKIKELTIQNLKVVIDEIQKGHFQVNPIRIGTKRIGCDYCPYLDICYRKEEDTKNKKELKMEDWIGGEKNVRVDQRANACHS